jgi:hypothetical protein
VRNDEGPQRIPAALKMFGVFPREAFSTGGVAARIVDELHTKINADVWPEYPSGRSPEQGVTIRLIVFSPKEAKHAQERKHIELQHALDFTKWRMRPGEPCAQYRSPKAPSANPWRGCTRLIVEALDESHATGDMDLPLERLIQNVLSHWDTP